MRKPARRPARPTSLLPLRPAVQAVNLQIKESVRQMRILAVVAPFAAVSGGADTFFIVTKAVASFIKVGLVGVVDRGLCGV